MAGAVVEGVWDVAAGPGPGPSTSPGAGCEPTGEKSITMDHAERIGSTRTLPIDWACGAYRDDNDITTEQLLAEALLDIFNKTNLDKWEYLDKWEMEDLKLKHKTAIYIAMQVMSKSRVQMKDINYAYKTLTIQPSDYIRSNNLGWYEGNIIKYVSRWQNKGGLEDLLKARDYLNKLIETTDASQK